MRHSQSLTCELLRMRADQLLAVRRPSTLGTIALGLQVANLSWNKEMDKID